MYTLMSAVNTFNYSTLCVVCPCEPWVWNCLYKMKVYIAQAFHVGYVFYGHL